MTANTMTRREALKTILAAGGAMGTAAFLPARWVKPLVESGVLPAHAQTSGVKPLGETQSFDFSGDEQTFEVPEGVKRIMVDAWGAGGGQFDNTYHGGEGARVQGAVLHVTAGETLYIYVGGKGHKVEQPANSGPGGYNGGGLGKIGGGGGGASDVRQGGSGLGKRVVVAGAGGGGINGGTGGNGGKNGADGGDSYPAQSVGGGGGTQSAGGSGGSVGNGFDGGNGGLGFGGDGNNVAGGGGGGGYYGGGGGCAGNDTPSPGGGPFGAGGGGSSLVPAGATVTSGADSDEDGKVILSW